MTRTAVATVLLLLAMAIGSLALSDSAYAEQGVRIYGFVYDRAGLPVANATVTLLLNDAPLPTGSNPAITDLHGYYEFSGIQHGVYGMIAEKNYHTMSATIRLQTWDLLESFTLMGSTDELADARETPATPTPTAVPEIITATPAPPLATSAPSAVPGFDVVIVLLGLFFLLAIKRRE